MGDKANHKACIGSLNIPELKNIDDKTKAFIYVDSFTNAGSAKERDHDYLQKLWDLESEYLDPLFEFLQPSFTND